jgi:hypothetical protein
MTDLPKSINSIVFLQRPTDVGSRASTILAIRRLRRNVWGLIPALVASLLMSSPKPETITLHLQSP